MKILHTIYDDVDNPWLGGGGAVRASEINRRLAKDHDITLVCGRYPGAAESEERDGYRIRRVGSDASYALSRVGFMGAASDLIGRESYDVWVYTFSAFAPLLADRETRRRAILEFHHHMGSHAVRKHPLAGYPAMVFERTVLRQYDTVIGVSPSVIAALSEQRGSGNLHLIYNGVHESCFTTPQAEEDFILYFGRFDIHNKGIDLLLPAFAAAGDLGLRLVLAGKSTVGAARWVEERARNLGIANRVSVTANASDTERSHLMGACLFAVQPSRYEGWGITALEIGASGKAVIASRIPGLIDAVRDEETGILVPPEDVDALARAIHRLAKDPERRRTLGKAAREYARNFTWDRVAQEHAALCLTVANR